MRTFMQKQNQAQKPVSSSLARPIFDLQRAIGNQAVLPVLQTHAEEPDVRLTDAASPRFRQDFSQIPVHPRATGAIQPKLAINELGDEYEQEAGRVSEQVIRIPEPQVHCAAAYAEGLRRSEAKQPDEGQERPETMCIGSSDLRQSAIPPIVHEVLRSPGRSLDPAVRAFMEPRLGHDFSHVRVHTDAKAAESASAINSLAYTAGRDLVFGEGQYVPGTPDGGRLLAHELTHVVQQGAFGQVEPTFIGRPSDRFEREADHVSTAITNPRLPPVGGWSAPIEALANPSMLDGMIQRKPAPDVGARKDEARLADLARYPPKAHRAWKKLNADDRGIVLAKMKQRYGAAFADQFRDVAEHGRADFSVIYWQPPPIGPTPEKLKAGGWRFLEMEVTGTAAIDVEVWVHPSGKTIRRDVSPKQAEAPKLEKIEEVEDEPTKLRKKFEDIKRGLWPKMAGFDSNVDRLQSKPAGEDRAPIDAAILTNRNTIRGLITDLSKLQTEADDIDESLADEISEEWANAMDQYTGISTRYNSIPP